MKVQQWILAHRPLSAVVTGVVFGIVMFVVGGGFDAGAVNIVLAVVLGVAFGIGWLWTLRRLRPEQPDSN
ncbi:MAG TPA: hypothetical protein VGQ85_09560 [Candidatus Limnocylindrales bacterium]|nr:hypothetical protein [Candidatus Limnocylindrales bacterium]